MAVNNNLSKVKREIDVEVELEGDPEVSFPQQMYNDVSARHPELLNHGEALAHVVAYVVRRSAEAGHRFALESAIERLRVGFDKTRKTRLTKSVKKQIAARPEDAIKALLIGLEEYVMAVLAQSAVTPDADDPGDEIVGAPRGNA